jgi:hypothetical protein
MSTFNPNFSHPHRFDPGSGVTKVNGKVLSTADEMAKKTEERLDDIFDINGESKITTSHEPIMVPNYSASERLQHRRRGKPHGFIDPNSNENQRIFREWMRFGHSRTLTRHVDAASRRIDMLMAAESRMVVGGIFGNLLTKIKNAFSANGTLTNLVSTVQRGVTTAKQYAKTAASWVKSGKEVFNAVKDIVIKSTRIDSQSDEASPTITTSSVATGITNVLTNIEDAVNNSPVASVVDVEPVKQLLGRTRQLVGTVDSAIKQTTTLTSDGISVFQKLLTAFLNYNKKMINRTKTVVDAMDGFKGGVSQPQEIGWTTSNGELDLVAESTFIADKLSTVDSTFTAGEVQSILSDVFSRNGFTDEASPVLALQNSDDVKDQLMTLTDGTTISADVLNPIEKERDLDVLPYDGLMGKNWMLTPTTPAFGICTAAATGVAGLFTIDINGRTAVPLTTALTVGAPYYWGQGSLTDSTGAAIVKPLPAYLGTFTVRQLNSVNNFWFQVWDNLSKHESGFFSFLGTTQALNIIKSHYGSISEPTTVFGCYRYWGYTTGPLNGLEDGKKMHLVYTLFKLWYAYLTDEGVLDQLPPTTGSEPMRLTSLLTKYHPEYLLTWSRSVRLDVPGLEEYVQARSELPMV